MMYFIYHFINLESDKNCAIQPNSVSSTTGQARSPQCLCHISYNTSWDKFLEHLIFGDHFPYSDDLHVALVRMCYFEDKIFL